MIFKKSIAFILSLGILSAPLSPACASDWKSQISSFTAPLTFQNFKRALEHGVKIGEVGEVSGAAFIPFTLGSLGLVKLLENKEGLIPNKSLDTITFGVSLTSIFAPIGFSILKILSSFLLLCCNLKDKEERKKLSTYSSLKKLGSSLLPDPRALILPGLLCLACITKDIIEIDNKLKNGNSTQR
jgi:hypothetical protein